MTSTRYQRNPVPFTEEYRPDLLGGVTIIHGKRYATDEAGWQNEPYREEAPTERELKITAVSYCVWDNRAPGCVPEIGTQNEHDSHHSESGGYIRHHQS
jgi:DUF1680 family protein